MYQIFDGLGDPNFFMAVPGGKTFVSGSSEIKNVNLTTGFFFVIRIGIVFLSRANVIILKLGSTGTGGGMT